MLNSILKTYTSNNENANSWSKTPENTAVRSSHRAHTPIQLSPSRQPNCVGAEGPKLLPEPGSLQQQNQPVNPPIPGFPYRYNRLSIVLNEPNPLPKIQTKPPCRANAAARKLLQLQRNPIFRRFFIGKTYLRARAHVPESKPYLPGASASEPSH